MVIAVRLLQQLVPRAVGATIVTVAILRIRHPTIQHHQAAVADLAEVRAALEASADRVVVRSRDGLARVRSLSIHLPKCVPSRLYASNSR